MTNDLVPQTVGDYVTLQRGTTYSGDLVGKPGPALLGLGSITPGGGFRPDFKTFGGECPTKLMLGPGDVFVALKGATKDGSMVGSVARVPPTLAAGRLTQDTARLDFKVKDPELISYIYWLLRTPQYRDYCDGRVTGSASASFSRDDFLAYPVPPLKPELLKIVRVLEAAEEKIDLNRQVNETLEAMARTLFRSWFVDFDPVRVKADSQKPQGMDAATAKLFPDSYEPSPLGPIPKGWRAARWGEIISLEYGKSLRGYESAVGTVPVYGTNGKIGWHTSPLCPHPGIVVGRKGAYRGVHYSTLPFFVIDTAYYVKPRGEVDLRWAYYEMLALDINSMDSGSAIPSTSRDDFYALPVIVPTVTIQKRFAELLSPIWQRQISNDEEARTLATTRDALLPKLLSGEVSVA